MRRAALVLGTPPAVALLAVAGTAGAAGSAGSGSSSSGSGPAPLSGSVTCTLTGSLVFTPPLRSAGAKADRITFAGTLSGCSGTVTPSTATVTGGTLTLASTAKAAANACGPLLTDGAALPDLAGMVVWKGPGTKSAAPTALTVSGASLFEDTNDNALVWTVPSGGASAATGSSFAGGVTWPSSDAAPGATKALGECRTGLEKLTLGTRKSPVAITFGSTSGGVGA